MPKTAIYPGTFDPITYGHIDVVQRAVLLFDHLVIAVAKNPKKKPLFDVEERIDMIHHVIGDDPRIEICQVDGLLVEFAEQRGAAALIRGLRAVSDFEYELQMAMVNRKLNERLITVFLMPHERYAYLNSSIVKELAFFDAEIDQFVPRYVYEKLKEKLRK